MVKTVLEVYTLAQGEENVTDLQYERVLLKVSGEACGSEHENFSVDALLYMAREIASIFALGVKIGVVIGGGNIMRGAELAKLGIDRKQADKAGMLATLQNAIMFSDVLRELIGTGEESNVRLLSAFAIPMVCEQFSQGRFDAHLRKGRVVFLPGGTGLPLFSTDTAAAHRAAEMSAEMLLMAKNGVDGVYDSDPKTNPDAVFQSELGYHELSGLNVMDRTSATHSEDNHIPIIVFDIMTPGNLAGIITGERIGTRIS